SMLKDLAQYQKMDFIGAYGGAYMHGYIDWDSTTSAMTPTEIYAAGALAQSANIKIGAFTPTGLYYLQTIVHPPDRAPPVVGPPNVQFTGADSVYLNWASAKDDVGTAGYYVFRNGIELTRTSLSEATDTNLAEGRTYSYTIRAFDASGNVSDPTPPTS